MRRSEASCCVTTLERTHTDATHWSRATMAKGSGCVEVDGRSDLEGVWARDRTGSDIFKISTDPQFMDKLRDVVGFYLHPPRKGPRALHGREMPNPSPGPLGTVTADDARHCLHTAPMTTSATA